MAGPILEDRPRIPRKALSQNHTVYEVGPHGGERFNITPKGSSQYTPVPQGDGANFASDHPRQKIHKSFYWQSPTFMIGSFFVGLILIIGHHFYYNWLNGQVVGNATRQQWALNIGNGFAALIGFSLRGALGTAYIQYLWREFRHKSISLKGIDQAISAPSNGLAIFEWEFVTRLPLSALMALVVWIIPLISLFAPATLSVTTTLSTNSTTIEALNLGTTNGTLWQSFSSESSKLSRVVDTAAITGQIADPKSLSIYGNSSYHLNSYAPIIHCSPANETVQSYLLSFISNATGTDAPFLNGIPESSINKTDLYWSVYKAEGDIGYFASVPYLYKSPNGTSWWKNRWNTTKDADKSKLEINTIEGQIWIAISNYNNTPKTTDYLNCELYNASLSFDVEFTNGQGRVANLTRALVNRASGTVFPGFPTNPYGGFFQGICEYLLGNVAAVSFKNKALGTASDRRTNTKLMKTYLGLASQVQKMYSQVGKNLTLYPVPSVSGEVEAIDFEPGEIQNMTFADAVEELSLKASLGFLSSPSLCDIQTQNATMWKTETIYIYLSRNLIITYSIAVFITALAVILGGFAYLANGVAQDISASTIATTMQDPGVRAVLEGYPGGVQPLDKQLGKLRLRFKGAEGFVIKEKRKGEALAPDGWI